MDILSILEQSAAEIRNLRQKVEDHEMLRSNQTVRVAVSQMRGNRIDYENADENEWNALNKLIDSGRVRMDSTGTVLIDSKVLTKELLTAEMIKESLSR